MEVVSTVMTKLKHGCRRQLNFGIVLLHKLLMLRRIFLSLLLRVYKVPSQRVLDGYNHLFSLLKESTSFEFLPSLFGLELAELEKDPVLKV